MDCVSRNSGKPHYNEENQCVYFLSYLSLVRATNVFCRNFRVGRVIKALTGDLLTLRSSLCARAEDYFDDESIWWMWMWMWWMWCCQTVSGLSILFFLSPFFTLPPNFCIKRILAAVIIVVQPEANTTLLKLSFLDISSKCTHFLKVTYTHVWIGNYGFAPMPRGSPHVFKYPKLN
jgi:hypothetical protein